MPPPVHVPELMDRIRKSGLVPMDEVEDFVADLDAEPIGGWTPPDLLERLVSGQILTTFQADRIAAGKYKGFVLGSYVILDRIGGGGMGQVFLAEHAEMRRLVALKVLSLPHLDDTVARERFLREARAAAALNHPHIIKVFDLNREGRMLYLVMEFLPGINLQALVAKTGMLSVAAATSAIHQVCQGLAQAHEMGLVHRDIKPSNILIDAQGTAKILDLGLVRSEADVDSRLTAQYGNAILGTADYLAPEQAVNSSNVDIRADLYSLGATLYFLLAGRPLFPEGRTAQKLMWQQWKEPDAIETFREDLPAGLPAFLKKAIAKKREDRHQTPAEFLEALAPFVTEAVAPPPELMPSVPQRRWMARVSDSSVSSSNIRLDSSATKTNLSVFRAKTETRLTTPSTILHPSVTALKPTPPPLGFPPARESLGRESLGRESLAPETLTEQAMLSTLPDNTLLTVQPRRHFPWLVLTLGLATGTIISGTAFVALRLLG